VASETFPGILFNDRIWPVYDIDQKYANDLNCGIPDLGQDAGNGNSSSATGPAGFDICFKPNVGWLF
jgi:hypothetical protein